MSRIARVISESGIYHILFRGVNQQNIFEETADFEKLKDAKKGTSPRGPVLVEEIVDRINNKELWVVNWKE